MRKCQANVLKECGFFLVKLYVAKLFMEKSLINNVYLSKKNLVGGKQIWRNYLAKYFQIKPNVITVNKQKKHKSKHLENNTICLKNLFK